MGTVVLMMAHVGLDGLVDRRGFWCTQVPGVFGTSRLRVGIDTYIYT